MDNQKRLVYSILQYLLEERRVGGLPPEIRESLEASIQCLQAAFEVTVGDRHLAVPHTLPEMFEVVTGETAAPPLRRDPEPRPHPDGASAEAERLKTEGNERMKTENFEAAVALYGQAIELNPSNAVYFCNRAAAYSRLGDYARALRDCRTATGIDPYYSKAHGRMGLALSSLNQYEEALVCYKKALRLDPDNATYKSYLRTAERSMREAPGAAEPPGGCNLAGLLRDSDFRSVAAGLLNSPQIRRIMSGILSRGHGPLRPPGADCARSPGVDCGQRGRQFIEQLERQDPELVEQLRDHVRDWSPSARSGNQQE